MALIQAARPGGSGGGGGGLTVTGFKNDQFTQDASWTAGTLYLTLNETPLVTEGIVVDYNGQRLKYDVDWDFNTGTNQVQILFGDPYVETYDTDPVFQVTYAY